jgi:hypothetical protein
MVRRVSVRWCSWPAILVMLACLSCTRLERVPLPQFNADDLVGREIRVTMIDGRVLEFEVEAVTDDGLVGRWARVRFDEIAQVERRGISVWRTAGAVAGAVAVAAAVGFIVFLVQWLGALSGT